MFLSTIGPAPTSQVVAETIPQARPVSLWLQAVKDGDQAQLKTCFSARMQRELEKEGWDNVMKIYQEVFKSEFGDYRPEDFSFRFQGSESVGTVLISYRGKTFPGLQVIKEGNEWRVDER
jgi:hypothetical protein